MSDKVHLSVIIPTYNSGKHLETCLISIFSQTFKNFEVIVMDSHSQDNTAEIVHQYQRESLRFISEKDSGIYDAINKSIELASGQWLYFLGSDDQLYAPDIFEKIFFRGHDSYDLIYGNVSSELLGYRYDGLFDLQKLLTKNICQQAIFYKKIVFQRIGDFFCGYKAHADWEHNIRCFKSKNISKFFLDETIAVFGSSGLSSNHKDVAFDNFMIWEKIKYESTRLRIVDRLRLIKGTVLKAHRARDKRLVITVLKDSIPFIISFGD